MNIVFALSLVIVNAAFTTCRSIKPDSSDTESYYNENINELTDFITLLEAAALSSSEPTTAKLKTKEGQQWKFNKKKHFIEITPLHSTIKDGKAPLAIILTTPKQDKTDRNQHRNNAIKTLKQSYKIVSKKNHESDLDGRKPSYDRIHENTGDKADDTERDVKTAVKYEEHAKPQSLEKDTEDIAVTKEDMGHTEIKNEKASQTIEHHRDEINAHNGKDIEDPGRIQTPVNDINNSKHDWQAHDVTKENEADVNFESGTPKKHNNIHIKENTDTEVNIFEVNAADNGISNSFSSESLRIVPGYENLTNPKSKPIEISVTSEVSELNDITKETNTPDINNDGVRKTVSIEVGETINVKEKLDENISVDQVSDLSSSVAEDDDVTVDRDVTSEITKEDSDSTSEVTLENITAGDVTRETLKADDLNIGHRRPPKVFETFESAYDDTDSKLDDKTVSVESSDMRLDNSKYNPNVDGSENLRNVFYDSISTFEPNSKPSNDLKSYESYLDTSSKDLSNYEISQGNNMDHKNALILDDDMVISGPDAYHHSKEVEETLVDILEAIRGQGISFKSKDTGKSVSKSYNLSFLFSK